jgi:type IV secretory pathway component VirB8
MSTGPPRHAEFDRHQRRAIWSLLFTLVLLTVVAVFAVIAL